MRALSMVRWTRFDSTNGVDGWASWLAQADDGNPFQSTAWAAYKRRFGWESEQWLACNDHHQPICGIQVLKKRLPLKKALIWVPGGPLLGFAARGQEPAGPLLASWLDQFRREHAVVYARFDSRLRAAEDLSDSLRRICRRPAVRINSGYTMHLDLRQPPEVLAAAMTSKHRYYVKQARAAGITWKVGQSDELAQDFLQLSQEVSRLKRMRSALFPSAHLAMLREAFGDRCLMLVGYRTGHPVTACVVLTVGPQAFYLLAATGALGRRVSAAYAMIPKLLETLAAWGVTRFDFGGIDPRSPSASGVDHFKRGFGGELIQHLGEWEWAAASPLRWAVNVLIGRRAVL